MRVNHNWFALVTVELVDRCRRGVCGEGVCPLGEGDEGEEDEKSRMCLLMRLSEKSHEALFLKSVSCMILCVFGNFGK